MDEDAAWRSILRDPAIREVALAPVARLKELLAARGWPERLVSELTPLQFTAATRMYAHLQVDHPGVDLPYPDDSCQLVLLEQGFLEIGYCPNGDPIVVDCEREPGAVFYLSHEELDWEEPGDLRELSRKVAPSVSDYLVRLQQARVPKDYFDGESGES